MSDNVLFHEHSGRGIVVGTLTVLRTGQLRNRSLIPGKGKMFVSSPKDPRPALGPTEPSIPWITRAYSPEVNQAGE